MNILGEDILGIRFVKKKLVPVEEAKKMLLPDYDEEHKDSVVMKPKTIVTGKSVINAVPEVDIRSLSRIRNENPFKSRKQDRHYHDFLNAQGIPTHKDGNKLGLQARIKLYERRIQGI